MLALHKNKEDEPSAKPGEDKSSLESDQEKSAKPSEDKPAEAPRRSCVIMWKQVAYIKIFSM